MRLSVIAQIMLSALLDYCRLTDCVILHKLRWGLFGLHPEQVSRRI